MHISKKYYGVLFSVTISVIMSAIMSFAMLAMNVGFVPHFGAMWLNSAVMGFIVATPTAMAVVPITRRFVDWLTSPATVAQAEKNLTS